MWLITAPMPVVTPQPMQQTLWKGASGRNLATAIFDIAEKLPDGEISR